MEMPDGKTLRYLELKKRHPGRKEALCSRNGSSQVALVIKNPPANAGDAKGSIPRLGRPLEKGMATYASILAWKIL